MWQIVYHFIAFFELILRIIVSFALIKPAACIGQFKNSFKLGVKHFWLIILNEGNP